MSTLRLVDILLRLGVLDREMYVNVLKGLSR